MDKGQATVLVTALAVLLVVVAILAVVLAVLLVGARRREREAVDERRRLERELEQSRRMIAPVAAEPVGGYLITDVGSDPGRREGSHHGIPVADRVVVSAVVGEPLLKAAAFAHGLRRALSPETRHRIAFTVRREIKRSRKERRREMRAAWQQSRRAERESQSEAQRQKSQARERAA